MSILILTKENYNEFFKSTMGNKLRHVPGCTVLITLPRMRGRGHDTEGKSLPEQAKGRGASRGYTQGGLATALSWHLQQVSRKDISVAFPVWGLTPPKSCKSRLWGTDLPPTASRASPASFLSTEEGRVGQSGATTGRCLSCMSPSRFHIEHPIWSHKSCQKHFPSAEPDLNPGHRWVWPKNKSKRKEGGSHYFT